MTNAIKINRENEHQFFVPPEISISLVICASWSIYLFRCLGSVCSVFLYLVVSVCVMFLYLHLFGGEEVKAVILWVFASLSSVWLHCECCHIDDDVFSLSLTCMCCLKLQCVVTKQQTHAPCRGLCFISYHISSIQRHVRIPCLFCQMVELCALLQCETKSK